MDQEITSLTVNGRSESLTLHLRMPFTNEDTDYTQRFAQIADKKGEAKAKAEYQIYVDTLAAWSAQHPELANGKKDEDGEPIKITVEGETPADAIKAYFADRTAAKEWMATTAISAFRNSLFPTVVFHEPSR